MGRTNPTYRDALRAVEDRWSDFRRALRERDRPRFDRLFAHAREHADAAGLLNHRRPVVPALFSVALEQARRLDDHEDRLDAHGDRLGDHARRLAALEVAVDADAASDAVADDAAGAGDAADAGDAVESAGDAG